MNSNLKTEWQQRNLGLVVTHPKVQVAADACAKLAKAIANNDELQPLVVLCGNPGCGKTELLNRMAKWGRANSMALCEQFWKYRRRPLCLTRVSWPTVCDGFKEGDYGVVKDLIDTDFALIDDIGAEYDPSRNAADKLCQILSRRESKWTLITTNIAPDSWHQKFDARIEDRLLRRSTIVDMFDVPSFAVAV
jgi:DNA replication protein DnaC